MTTQILPCPFCGGKADCCYVGERYWVKCLQCEASGPERCSTDEAKAAWNQRYEPIEYDDGSRPCEREGCNTMVDEDWPYGWCETCCETGLCRHGNRPHECNECMIESDLAYDGAREEQAKKQIHRD